jgi:SAM-dependent methyltransferase
MILTYLFFPTIYNIIFMKMKLYTTLAPYYSVLNPNGIYDAEIWHYLSVLQENREQLHRIMELGSGVGAMAESFPSHFDVTLVDISEDMLFESQKRNPNKKHVQCDIRNISLETLGEKFDAILLHDAVMYLTTEEDLYKTFAAAKKCLCKDGVLLVVPDVYLEDFEEHFLAGGEDGWINNEPVSVRLSEWHWRNEKHEHQIFVEFSMLIRHEDQSVQNIHETHTMGLYSREQYVQNLQKAGFSNIVVREDGILAHQPM